VKARDKELRDKKKKVKAFSYRELGRSYRPYIKCEYHRIIYIWEMIVVDREERIHTAS